MAKVAYADPPYIGQAKKHYGKEESYGGEVDHVALVASLQQYDGWALSASSPSLQYILSICPPTVRVGAWVKPFCSFKPNVNPAYAWEPVIFVPARKRGRDKPTIRDFVSANITLKKGLSGAKPPAFSAWIYDLLQMEPEDEFIDLFPGTGAVSQEIHNIQAKGESK